MRVSWKWLSDYLDLSSLTPEKLGDLLTARGLEVEAIERQDQGFEKVVTAKLLERKPHPQADRLSLCKVSLGEGKPPLDIVCGAQNMKSGDTVALAQVGALLPNGLKIAASKIRGEPSEGMLCSLSELKLAEESEGIIILPEGTPIGRPLSEVLGRADTVLTLKLTANRGDCLSHFGLAREVASALRVAPKEPWLDSGAFTDAQKLAAAGTGSPIRLELRAEGAAPEFVGLMVEGVKVGPSPAWVVQRLEAAGSRSINSVVDATNLAMLELGHPLHAYDADKLEGGVVGVRMARAGEALPLLDGETVALAGTELVIFDHGGSASGDAGGGRPIGLAGVMGGGNSEVGANTTRVFLECALFEPTLVRKAAQKHQRRSDAAQRFEKGIDPQGLTRAIARAAQFLVEWSGGRVTGSARAKVPAGPGGAPNRVISVEPAFFARFLGMEIAEAEARAMLEALGCEVRPSAGEWKVTPPSWRMDLRIREDLAEELARSLGYDRIPETIPELRSPPGTRFGAPAAARLALIDRAKDALASLGLCETVNFAFHPRPWLESLGFTPRLGLLNPLSDDLKWLAPSLLPGLLRNALDQQNQHWGSEALTTRLFELRPTFDRADDAGADDAAPLRAVDEMTTPTRERWRLAVLLAGPRLRGGLAAENPAVDFGDLKGIFERLLDELGARGVRLVAPLEGATGGASPETALWHPGQRLDILAGKDLVGSLGRLHPAREAQLKLRSATWIAELDWEKASKLCRPAHQPRLYAAWPKFPGMERDFAVVVKSGTSAERVVATALKAGRPLAKAARVFDVYEGAGVPEGMTSLAVRVIFSEESRSLQESEAEVASAKILDAWKGELGATLRGT